MVASVSYLLIQLLQQQHLLTAAQMVAALHAQGRMVNKTSVYRALEKLEAEGQVCKQNLRDNELVYELRHDHHDHLVCLRCGKVQTAECLITLEYLPNGFRLDHHHLTVFGTCAECQRAQSTIETTAATAPAPAPASAPLSRQETALFPGETSPS